MPVQIACPNPDCDSSYSVDDANLGKLGRCKKCGTKFPLVPGTRVGETPSSWQSLQDPMPTEVNHPDSFGRYKVVRLLGQGGMGRVYLALDTQLNRQVALKVPHLHAFTDRPDLRKRFLLEAQAAAQFQHPNFCPIYDIGEAEGVPYLTMAFIKGKTLADSIERNQAWPERRAVEVVRELALALAKAHNEGIIHRDLKPANVMIDAEGRMVLMDFGLARWYDTLDSSLTPTGAILGTPAYMSPEQAEGNLKTVGPRSDLYSLGVILYELLTGRRPFDGPISKVLGMIAYIEPEPLFKIRPEIDSQLEAICLKAMAKKLENRYASMYEFADALSLLLDEPIVKRTPDLRLDERPADLPRLKIAHERLIIHRDQVRNGTILAIFFGLMLFGVHYLATKDSLIKIKDPDSLAQVNPPSPSGSTLASRNVPPTLTNKTEILPPITKKLELPPIDKSNPPPTLKTEKSPAPNLNPEIKKVEPPPIDKTKTGTGSPPSPPKVVEPLITNSIGMKLTLISAGEFFMGASKDESGAKDDEKPSHRVLITKDFYLGIYEVTQDEYEMIVGNNPSYFSSKWLRDKSNGAVIDTSRWPVEMVDWLEAIRFCNELSEREKLIPFYTRRGDSKPDGNGYRLPTEAEWEYACRAGSTTPFACGATLNPSMANFNGSSENRGLATGSSLKRPVRVGNYRPNAFGLFDMHGNVQEWCADHYNAAYYRESPPSDPSNDSGNAGVSRGGSWDDSSPACRSANRDFFRHVSKQNKLGFRVARAKP